VFTAQEPEGIGPEKYDETAGAMIAQLKYGSGVPFYRMEKLESQLGIPLPAATQWEIVEDVAAILKPAHDECIRQAAQGEVMHNDDTSMRVLKMEREPGDDRTGVFTSGIVSTREGGQIALYFTGRQHAGENLGDVLQQRAAELPGPIQMCDALSRNTPKSNAGAEILLANCMAHGRRQFVDVAANFPEQCRYVLEMLGEVYGHDAKAREARMTSERRLQFHTEHSGSGDDETAWMAGGADCRAQDGAEFRARQGDQVPAESLAATDAFPPCCWGAARQQHRRKSFKTGRFAQEERFVLSDIAWGASGRPVHEPDSHLPAVRRQFVRVSDGTAATCARARGQSGGVDAMELSPDAVPRRRRMRWPKAILFGQDSENARNRVSSNAKSRAPFLAGDEEWRWHAYAEFPRIRRSLYHRSARSRSS
jgi:hypothetical protein